MPLLAAVRRGACRMVSGSGRPPSLAVVLATKAVDAAHADACRAWDALFARGTPAMHGAESDLSLAQYFYGVATPLLARASSSSATSEEVGRTLRHAASDLMDGTAAVLRASACLRGEISVILRDGASCYLKGATDMLRGSGSTGEHSACAWHINASASSIVEAGSHFHSAVAKIHDKYSPGGDSTEGDLVKMINTEFESAKEAQDQVNEMLQNFPFEIKEKYSCTDLILVRRYEDEQIEVVVSAPFLATAITECNWAGSASGSTKDEPKSVLALQVTVTKDGSLSMFTCTASESEVRVDTVYMRLTVGEDDNEEYKISFEGANSTEMLQKLVYRYLELRGITMMNASFLHQLLSKRGVFTNILWLELLKDFVKQPTAQRK